ncbi:PEP-CTERM sorting domain-containing protein [Fuerstiella marisgermanici]|uniref:Ice-binding protein C-terminal domain-containing protein n=1 Tax=Fuerstiella marisgermanici TaxID=1891926 RepID=A0A1P8WB95_9PLAN|nr:PEP-CTERM sorting domain-containing protein [Fuerstiella marisgermanici]APZ91332.1 hypothetical protein Fuma_00920 [Fuerstiella marisgermanici]
MKHQCKFMVSLPALAFGLLLNCAATADIIVNGGFELDANTDGIADGWTYASQDANPPNLTLGINASRAFEGNNFVGFNSGNQAPNGIVQQLVPTNTGTEYTVTFHVARLANSPFFGTSQIFGEAFDGTGTNQLGSLLLQDLTGSPFGDPNRPSYEMGSFSFTATGTQSLIRFSDATTNNGQNFDTSLDAVSVTAVPEPSSYALLSGAGIGFVVVGRRRRANARRRPTWGAH